MADGSEFRGQPAHPELPTGGERLSVVSFFAGCGGLDLGMLGGFEYLGQAYPRTAFEVIAAYDLDPKSVAAYTANIGSHAHIADLSKKRTRSIPAADVLIGGFPCQEFSHCGPRKGLNSERGRLYRAMVRYAKLHQPKLVLAENVAGLKYLEGGIALKTIARDFGKAGFRSLIWELKAQEFGVPQKRHRVILAFVRNDLPFHLLQPPVAREDSTITVRQAISDLLVPGRSKVPNQSQYFKAAKASQGHGQGDEKSPADEPGYTIRANSRSRVQFHYCRPRRLSVRECARLQSFPDTFIFPFDATSNMRLVGNAVPPVLAYAVAVKAQEFLHHRAVSGA